MPTTISVRKMRHYSYWHEADQVLGQGLGQLLTDTVEKRFQRSERATLIQDWSLARNIDSKNAASGFDYCSRAVCGRVFQQYRPLSDISGLAVKPTVESSRAARLELACAVWSFCLSDLCQAGCKMLRPEN